MTCNIQSECYISGQHSCTLLKFVYNIDPRYFSKQIPISFPLSHLPLPHPGRHPKQRLHGFGRRPTRQQSGSQLIEKREKGEREELDHRNVICCFVYGAFSRNQKRVNFFKYFFLSFWLATRLAILPSHLPINI